jgi:hypothetical protein
MSDDLQQPSEYIHVPARTTTSGEPTMSDTLLIRLRNIKPADEGLGPGFVTVPLPKMLYDEVVAALATAPAPVQGEGKPGPVCKNCGLPKSGHYGKEAYCKSEQGWGLSEKTFTAQPVAPPPQAAASDGPVQVGAPTEPHPFQDWWDGYNRCATDDEAMDLRVYILSNPGAARREAAEAAWKAALATRASQPAGAGLAFAIAALEPKLNPPSDAGVAYMNGFLEAKNAAITLVERAALAASGTQAVTDARGFTSTRETQENMRGPLDRPQERGIASIPESVAVPEQSIEALREAAEWVINDANYKAPEQIGEVAERWLGRLRAALSQPALKETKS